MRSGEGRIVRFALGSRNGGFTYLAVLIAVAVLCIGLLAVSQVWVASARRSKLAELDWIGAQFTQAIGSYYYATPGAAKAYPASLQDLLIDRRYVTVRRHLRSIYANPFTGRADWQLVFAADGTIRGVRVMAPGDDDGGMAKEFVYHPGAI